MVDITLWASSLHLRELVAPTQLELCNPQTLKRKYSRITNSVQEIPPASLRYPVPPNAHTTVKDTLINKYPHTTSSF